MCGLGPGITKKPPRDYEAITKAGGPVSIILVREAMSTLAKDLRHGYVSPQYAANMIDKLADATKRKPAVSKAPKRIRPLSEETRAKVRETHRINPTMSQLELANLYNTNPGRISEALNEGRP